MTIADIETDVVAEGRRLVGAARDAGLPLRLLGGVAVCVSAGVELPEAFARRYNDADLITGSGLSGEAQRFFEANGYSPNVRFNALNGRERLMFLDEGNERQVDVFVGSFRMSHEVPIGDRLEIEPETIPLAELLLTKLQVVQLNDKDARDALALLATHEVEDRDGGAINGTRVAELCSQDWGLCRTFTGNLAVCRERLAGYELAPTVAAKVAARLTALQDRIEGEPKTRRWRLRARVGERKRWYELPEEVEGGA